MKNFVEKRLVESTFEPTTLQFTHLKKPSKNRTVALNYSFINLKLILDD